MIKRIIEGYTKIQRYWVDDEHGVTIKDQLKQHIYTLQVGMRNTNEIEIVHKHNRLVTLKRWSLWHPTSTGCVVLPELLISG